MPRPPNPAYVIDAVVGDRAGTPVELVVLGDSVAAGVGATRMEESLPVAVAQRVAAALGRPVHVVGHGVGGARAATTRASQVPKVSGTPDVVVLVVGGNDVLHLTPPARFLAEMRARARSQAGHGSADRADRQPRGSHDAGARPPSARAGRGVRRAAPRAAAPCDPRGSRALRGRHSPGHADVARDRSLFAQDRFHPSAAGYAVLADALAPAVARTVRGA